MRKLFILIFVLLCGSLWLGCEDDEACFGGECVDDVDCLQECDVVCGGEFNVETVFCTLELNCFCECFEGCF